MPNGRAPEDLVIACLGHKDVFGQTIPLPQIIRWLSSIKRTSALIALGRLKLILDNNEPDDLRLQLELINRLFAPEVAVKVSAACTRERGLVTFNRLQVLTMLKFALCFCTERSEDLLTTIASQQNLANQLLALNDHLFDAAHAPDGTFEAKKLAVAEHSLKSHFFNAGYRSAYTLVRYFHMYTEIAAKIPQNRDLRRIRSLFRQRTGVSIETMLTVGFGLYANYIMLNLHNPGGPAEPYIDMTTYFSATRLRRVDIARSVRWLSSSTQTMIRRVRSEVKIDADRYVSAYAQVRLREKPLLLDKGRYLACLDNRFLVEKLSRGVYYEIFNSLHTDQDKKRFNGLFGDLLESYARKLLRRIFRTRYRRIKYGTGFEVADGVILYPAELVVVEIKSARLLLETIQKGSLTSFERDIDRIVLPACRQLHRGIEALRSGAARVPRFPPGLEVNYHPVLLTAEEFPVYPWLNEIIVRRLQEAGLLTGRRIAPLTILDIEDLELIEPALARHELLDVMKRRYGDLGFRNLSFRNAMVAYLGEEIERNEWMRRKYQRLSSNIQRRMFGGGTADRAGGPRPATG